ncbi:transmembrane emp24 domain-containing protein 5-like [Neocloeon triangulifer]|uniref:transmembrane emp24 domain-containing protein 5-like n=1 Tax=Neocloeon triangulifer TaxID=2078957 RepID=UPI00286F480F|nr:transmembrane emp24 domain-containing protein 5-like [Neocloeon triangulifer]
MNMTSKTSFSCIILLLCSTLCSSSSKENEMTVSIDPGVEECFFQNLKFGTHVDVEYQVIDGGQGELDINFNMWSPSSHLVVSDYKKSENSHRFPIQEDGDYKFCWDNSFSSYNSKTVFFEILVETEGEGDDWNWDEDIGLTAEDVYEIKVQDIQEAISRVHLQLTKVRHVQDQIRAHEARDRNIAEGNFTRVNSWSMIQICLMIAVGVVQVIMVRSLFDDSSKVNKLWKKANLGAGVSSYMPFN